MSRAWIALGGNLGNREQLFAESLLGLEQSSSVKIVRGSPVYQTPAVGPGSQEDYWNAVVEVETSLSPKDLLDLCLETEIALGRIRRERWGPRLIDLDLLLYEDQEISEQNLSIPHPRLHQRGFVLMPLADLTADHVVRGKSISDWLKEANCSGIVQIKDSVLS